MFPFANHRRRTGSRINMMSLSFLVFMCVAVNVFGGFTNQEKAEMVYNAMDLWFVNDKLGGRERAFFFKRMDCDGNDEISEAESFCVGKFLEVGDTLWTFLTSADSNSDKLLTLDEYKAFWDVWDFNVNNRITWNEFESAWNATNFDTAA
ncbi:uncharacterized protein LOC132720489 [Ruditapes philippinarum]|uniref:uncharacterized protein LOC132720489 n=1 Tax=Ruditapes philippinarum TaxID=129788 RepID=UPI00295ACCC1|nr:uncharacterized protein LOC132720489 [Ruditapes philippinarum]